MVGKFITKGQGAGRKVIPIRSRSVAGVSIILKPVPVWSKSIYFSMVADDRFTDDINKEIQRKHDAVMKNLKDSDRFNVYFRPSGLLTFEDGKTKQYRMYYRVEVNKNNTKKNDLYALVNAVHPVYYGSKFGD